MKRYSQLPDMRGVPSGMFIHKDGVWVLYSDHKAAVDELVGALEKIAKTEDHIEIAICKGRIHRCVEIAKAAIDKYREKSGE